MLLLPGIFIGNADHWNFWARPIAIGTVGAVWISGHKFDRLAHRGVVRQSSEGVVFRQDIGERVGEQNDGFCSENLRVSHHRTCVVKLADSHHDHRICKIEPHSGISQL